MVGKTHDAVCRQAVTFPLPAHLGIVPLGVYCWAETALRPALETQLCMHLSCFKQDMLPTHGGHHLSKLMWASHTLVYKTNTPIQTRTR